MLSQYHAECFLKQLALKVNKRGNGSPQQNTSNEMISRPAPSPSPSPLLDLLGAPVASSEPVDLLGSNLLQPTQSSGSLLNPLMTSSSSSSSSSLISDAPQFFSSMSLVEQPPPSFLEGQRVSPIPSPIPSPTPARNAINPSLPSNPVDPFSLFPQTPTHQPLASSSSPSTSGLVPLPSINQPAVPQTSPSSLLPSVPSVAPTPGLAPPSLPPKHVYEESLHVFIGYTSIVCLFSSSSHSLSLSSFMLTMMISLSFSASCAAINDQKGSSWRLLISPTSPRIEIFT